MKTTEEQRLSWGNTQRSNYKAGKLSLDRVCKLRAVGFRFESRFIVTARQNKNAILAEARKGNPIPKGELGYAIVRYCTKNHAHYDSIFDKEVRSLRPDWMILSGDYTRMKKKELLKMARRGDPKPEHGKYLGATFWSFVMPRRSGYDPKFAKKIAGLRPDWMIPSGTYFDKKKKRLLELAKSGIALEWYKHPVVSLRHYTDKSCKWYDPEFNMEIRSLRPDWFSGGLAA